MRISKAFLRIGIDVSQITYGTGVSNYTKLLVEHLLKIDNKNQYVIFGSALRAHSKLVEFSKTLLEKYKNVEFHTPFIPPAVLEPLWNIFALYPIESFIGEVDVFHTSDWIQPPFKNKNTKIVTTIHDMTPSLFPASVHKKIIAAQKRSQKKIKKRTDLIFADSQTTKDDIHKFLDIPQEKIKVVYLAPSENFKPQDEGRINEILEKYKIKKPYILSVATQEPRKNIQKLLDVFTKMSKNNPQLRMVLTGKYGWGPGLRSTENVIWTDYVPDEDLAPLYAGSRVFVYPSLYEGFGLPILEAMACGTPVVTSNNSSMAEIAKEAAILVDPRSESQLQRAIEFVMNLNLENYQKMVRASINRARLYTWTKTARETLSGYEEVVRNANRS